MLLQENAKCLVILDIRNRHIGDKMMNSKSITECVCVCVCVLPNKPCVCVCVCVCLRLTWPSFETTNHVTRWKNPKVAGTHTADVTRLKSENLCVSSHPCKTGERS